MGVMARLHELLLGMGMGLVARLHECIIVMMCMALHSDAAARVEFTHSYYNVSEGEGLLQVCASINVKLEVNVLVNILSEDITAQGVYTCTYNDAM